MNNSLKFNTIKCCIVGSCNVGKTSIIQKYISKKNGLTDTTLGAIYWLIEHTSKSGIKFNKIDSGIDHIFSLSNKSTTNSNKV